jgi:hypothetical protein
VAARCGTCIPAMPGHVEHQRVVAAPTHALARCRCQRSPPRQPPPPPTALFTATCAAPMLRAAPRHAARLHPTGHAPGLPRQPGEAVTDGWQDRHVQQGHGPVGGAHGSTGHRHRHARACGHR